MNRFYLAILIAFTLTTMNITANATQPKTETATFAGGCFWCMEKPFEKIPGVISVISGYMGAGKDTASYEQVSKGNSGHREVIQVKYDPDKVTYKALLDTFWININPFDDSGQFCDQGFQYTTAIYTNSQVQKKAAIASQQKVMDKFPGRTVVTPVIDASEFFPAEEYHQDYYKKNPTHYAAYRFSCGRDRILSSIWTD